jgi:hypothetical protein
MKPVCAYALDKNDDLFWSLACDDFGINGEVVLQLRKVWWVSENTIRILYNEDTLRYSDFILSRLFRL